MSDESEPALMSKLISYPIGIAIKDSYSIKIRKQFFSAAICIGMTLINELIFMDTIGKNAVSMIESANVTFKSLTSFSTVEFGDLYNKVEDFLWYQCQLSEARKALKRSQPSLDRLRKVNAEIIVANKASMHKRASLNRALIKENGRSVISALLEDVAELEKCCEVIGADMREALKEFEETKKIESEMDKQINEAFEGIKKTKSVISTLASRFKSYLENHDTSYIFEELGGQI